MEEEIKDEEIKKYEKESKNIIKYNEEDYTLGAKFLFLSIVSSIIFFVIEIQVIKLWLLWTSLAMAIGYLFFIILILFYFLPDFRINLLKKIANALILRDRKIVELENKLLKQNKEIKDDELKKYIEEARSVIKYAKEDYRIVALLLFIFITISLVANQINNYVGNIITLILIIIVGFWSRKFLIKKVAKTLILKDRKISELENKLKQLSEKQTEEKKSEKTKKSKRRS